jgi:hypothetical protein
MNHVESIELKELREQVDDLVDDVKDIKKAILGDDFNPTGYTKRLDNIETRLDNVEDFIMKWKWIVVGAIAFAGYGGITMTQNIIQLFVHK